MFGGNTQHGWYVVCGLVPLNPARANIILGRGARDPAQSISRLPSGWNRLERSAANNGEPGRLMRSHRQEEIGNEAENIEKICELALAMRCLRDTTLATTDLVELFICQASFESRHKVLRDRRQFCRWCPVGLTYRMSCDGGGRQSI